MARILIVDDERHIRLFYSLELTEAGYEVRAANGGCDLLGLIRDFKPDLLVLDIYLTRCNGLNLLHNIRAHHRCLPVILCSAREIYKYEPRSIAADYFVVKSYDLGNLKRKISRALENRAGGDGNTPPAHMGRGSAQSSAVN